MMFRDFSKARAAPHLEPIAYKCRKCGGERTQTRDSQGLVDPLLLCIPAQHSPTIAAGRPPGAILQGIVAACHGSIEPNRHMTNQLVMSHGNHKQSALWGCSATGAFKRLDLFSALQTTQRLASMAVRLFKPVGHDT